MHRPRPTCRPTTTLERPADRDPAARQAPRSVSNAALQRVRRLAGGIKAGHAGSLDPLASACCRSASVRLPGSQRDAGLRKCYQFGVQLERSETGDAEGAIVERCPVPPLTGAAVEAVLARFHGPQQQVAADVLGAPA